MTTYDPIEFPDAEAIVRTVLLAGQPVFGHDGPVSTAIPNPRPAEFTRLLRTGGPWRDIVTDEATVIVESWAADNPSAVALAQINRALLHAAHGTVVAGVTIYTVNEFSGPSNLPDPSSDQARYTQTFSIALRGTTAEEVVSS